MTEPTFPNNRFIYSPFHLFTAIYGYRRQHTVGLLLAAATLTAYPLWKEPSIAVLWWTANKVLTAWLYLLVRRVLVRST